MVAPKEGASHVTWGHWYLIAVYLADDTASPVRVLIESTDGVHLWRTVGSRTDVIEASSLALVASLGYWLHKYGEGVT